MEPSTDPGQICQDKGSNDRGRISEYFAGLEVQSPPAGQRQQRICKRDPLQGQYYFQNYAEYKKYVKEHPQAPFEFRKIIVDYMITEGSRYYHFDQLALIL